MKCGFVEMNFCESNSKSASRSNGVYHHGHYEPFEHRYSTNGSYSKENYKLMDVNCLYINIAKSVKTPS